MDHMTLRGNYYEMGVRQGQMFEKENILFPLRLDEFQRRHGRASESLLKEIFPEVCSEIEQQKRGVCSDGRQPLSDYNVFFH